MYWKLWKYLLGKNGQVSALKWYAMSQSWLELWCSCLCHCYETGRNGTCSFKNPNSALTQPLLTRPTSSFSGLPYSKSWTPTVPFQGSQRKQGGNGAFPMQYGFELDPWASLPLTAAKSGKTRILWALQRLDSWGCSRKFGTSSTVRLICVWRSSFFPSNSSENQKHAGDMKKVYKSTMFSWNVWNRSTMFSIAEFVVSFSWSSVAHEFKTEAYLEPHLVWGTFCSVLCKLAGVTWNCRVSEKQRTVI